MSLFTGSGVALITPFHKDLSVNYQMLDILVDWHLASGTDALIILGTTAETATLKKPEKLKIIKRVVKRVNKKIPVIVGTGTNATFETMLWSKQVETLGVDGLLVVTPYYNKPTQQGLYQHFKAVSESVELPIILYNVPSRTGVNLEVETVVRLASIKNIIGIKEAGGNLEQLKGIIDLTPDDFTLYSGNDDELAESIALGAKGIISVTANLLPKEVHREAISYLKGENMKLISHEIHYAMFIETSPAPVKKALCYLGYEVGSTRLPLVDLEVENQKKLYDILTKYHLVLEV